MNKFFFQGMNRIAMSERNGRFATPCAITPFHPNQTTPIPCVLRAENK